MQKGNYLSNGNAARYGAGNLRRLPIPHSPHRREWSLLCVDATAIRIDAEAREATLDRIQTGTLLIAGAITRGDVTVTRCRPGDLLALTQKLDECGVVVTTGADWIRVQADAVKSGTDIVTAPHPGFPTDLQPQMLTFLCTTPGTSVVEESIFNARFSYVNELARMGADVKVSMESNTSIVKGVAQLSGAPVEAPDIRAGAALVVAGLAAAGETEIIGLEYIDRGYERLEEMLSALGGQVQRSSGVTPLVEPAGLFETREYPRVSSAAG